MAYQYKHKDGRIGKGWSCWASIVACIGPIEATKIVHNVEDPIFDKSNEGRIADVIVNNEKIGEILEIGDSADCIL